MTQTFRAGQKSKSPKTSSPVQTSLLASRPFPEPVQQKAQQPNLQTILQRAERAGNPISEKPIQKQEESIPNQTGLPDNLKAGIENLSGYSLDDVRVHYNSPKPAQLQALAYTQGTDIHVAPGQEKHLPHEAWHVVQQMQERVKPTMQMKGVQINDNEGLEREADAMGSKILQMKADFGKRGESKPLNNYSQGQVVQKIIDAATFATQTAGTLFKPRRTVDRIDDALNLYHAANQADKLARLDDLMVAINDYITAQILANDADNVRIAPSRNLLIAASQERIQVLKLDALVRAPHGAIAATLADTLNAPLNNLTLQELNGILAVGHIVTLADLGALLTAATSAQGAGTPALRLTRVLTEVGPPHTPAALALPLANKLSIDEKILRGRSGIVGSLPLGVAPTGPDRTLIGGHSPAITNDPANFVIENVVHNPNNTDYVSFRKLLRGDTTGFATDIVNNAPGNIINLIQAQVNLVHIAAQNPPPDRALIGMSGRAPIQAQLSRALARRKAQVRVGVAHGQFLNHLATVNLTAPAASGNPNDATQLRPFIDAMSDLFASADALIGAGIPLVPAVANPALLAFQNIQTNFAQNGPVLSVKKNSTTAPAGWSDDDILRAGDQTAAQPATLFRHRAFVNNPPNNTPVETKHQLVIRGMVWVVIKNNVTYTTPPPTVNGGTLISSYPTNLIAIPPDPVYPAQDGDGFCHIH
ncbi:DUF4157 domain-containing protein [Limnoraphis robusta]|uniref:DUF4157 domain-containing protein n=1 Tax=Limnoraphis robusta CCNP1315 TaxID=3110306 RepID=A0ABU5TYG2_9CYAN|nr:DUF4157 domain-containing protein [Limnoraphis robusta]MEA5519971.1 DUF4157 domain-containing protein [Limnoraphis robusta CCNP1315]MEA5544923.1 DUF4157 domain-containing protein [Limnoraphis robusta CCNP1324]